MGSDEKLPALHHLLVVEPDVEIAADAVDVGLGDPGLAGVLGVGMAKGDVDAGNFFVLQDVADDAGAGGVGADGKFADAVAVFVRAGVGAKFFEQLLVVTGQRVDAVLLHLDRERRLLEVAILLAKIIADHAVNDKDAVAYSQGEVKISPPGRLPHLSGVMMPLVLSHFSLGERSATKSVPRGVRQVTRLVRRARSTSRWLSASIAMKSARIPSRMIWRLMFTMCPWRMRFLFTTSLISMREPSSPRWVWAQKIETCEVARSSRISRGMLGERAVRVFLENENRVIGTDLLDLLLKSGGDLARRLIGDDGDAFVRLKPQAIADGVASAGSQLGINGEGGGGETVGHGDERSPWREKPTGAIAGQASATVGTFGCGTVRCS